MPGSKPPVEGTNITNDNASASHSSPIGTEEIVSIFNHEAFVTKYMPNMGYDVKEFQVFHWRLQGWTKLEGRLASSEFDCSEYKWQINLYPSGVPSNRPDAVSIYLNCVGPKGAGRGWHACAQFVLVISNPHDPTIRTVCHARHRFTTKEHDWGFPRFSELRTLYHPQHGHSRPVIEEDSAVASVYVRVLEDPTGVLWQSHDSKKETGSIGLKNYGATSYMNTMLQSLFFTNYFRRAVYQIPTKRQNPTNSVPLALQRVFYNLQTSDQPVDTTELTSSLGWRSTDSFVRSDIDEFNGVFQHQLESFMKGTRAEGAIQKLFVGKTRSWVECVNVNYEASGIEEFYDIELDVKGIKTLYDSFQDHTAVKTLDGEFKYRAGGLGLQDARKRVTFESLPPVLHLKLKRHNHDAERDTMVKIDNRFEFPFEIDLAEFLDETADRTKPWKYKLHTVIVYSGDLQDGRYFAFIKPDQHTGWLRFDDERVTPATDREVMEENYGGEPLNSVVPQAQRNFACPTNKFTSVRTLVYIRESAIDEVLAPLTKNDTPRYLKQRLDEERAQMETKKEEREEERLFLTVKVVTDETFSRHQGFDLAVFDKWKSSLSDLPTFRVLKQETYSIFKSRVVQRFGYPESQIRLWVLTDRQNKTVRPNTHVPENEPSLTVETIRANIAVQPPSDLRLYLDILPDPSKIRFDSAGTMLILLKHFDAKKQSLLGVGKIHMPRANKVSDLIPVINKEMKWASGTPLKLYEEIEPGMIDLMEPKDSLDEMRDGDIICFQVDISDKEVDKLKSRGLYRSNPELFYELL